MISRPSLLSEPNYRGPRRRDAYLDNALDVLESDIGVDETAPEQLQQNYQAIRNRLDSGEAEALVAGHMAGGTFVTDDGPARGVPTEYDVAVTGSIGVLVRGVVREDVSIDTADEWLTTWIEERTYYAPVDSITAALPDDFEAYAPTPGTARHRIAASEDDSEGYSAVVAFAWS